MAPVVRSKGPPPEEISTRPPPGNSGDMSATVPIDRPRQITERRDDHFLAALLQELNRRTDLRAHAAFGKLARREELADLGQANPLQLPLITPPIMHRDSFDTGRDQQQR